MKIKKIFLVLTILTLSIPLNARIIQKKVIYRDGNTKLRGYMIYDTRFRGKRPGVIVVHEWWGLNQTAINHSRKIARYGYIAFAADIHGAGKVTNNPKIAKKYAIAATPAIKRRRSLLALKQLLKFRKVNKRKIGAIGFCFGGSTVLQLAYTGTKINGVVSIHGSWPTGKTTDKINTKILVLHGVDDRNAKPDHVKAFKEKLNRLQADYQLVFFSNTVHAFTNPKAGNNPKSNVAYNPVSAKRAWLYTKLFFKEVF